MVEELLRHIVRHFDFADDGRWLDELDWSKLEQATGIRWGLHLYRAAPGRSAHTYMAGGEARAR